MEAPMRSFTFFAIIKSHLPDYNQPTLTVSLWKKSSKHRYRINIIIIVAHISHGPLKIMMTREREKYQKRRKQQATKCKWISRSCDLHASLKCYLQPQHVCMRTRTLVVTLCSTWNSRKQSHEPFSKKRMKKKETTKNKHRAVKDMDVWLSWESRFQHKKYTQGQKQQQHHKLANFIIGSSAVAMVVRLKWKVNNPTMRYKLLWCVFTNEWLNDCQLSTIQC